MDEAVRQAVRQRAQGCCEYCRLPQHQAPFAVFHVDHIVPRQHGGRDDLENLALACQRCNWNKGTNLTGIDPVSALITRLFHPRTDVWASHFRFNASRIEGLTDVGRTTVAVLDLNSAERLELRSQLAGQ